MRAALCALAVGAPALLAGCGGDDEAEIDLAKGCNIADARCQRAIFDLTAQVRGDAGARLPSTRTMTVQQFADWLEGDVATEGPDVWSRVLPLLRLLPEGGSVTAETADVAVAQVTAFYDPRTKQVTVLDRGQSVPSEDLVTLSHEYVHALQDTELDLVAFQQAWGSSLDSVVATKSVLEGEATVLSAAVLSAALGRSRSAINWAAIGTSIRASFFETVKDTDAPLFAAAQLAPYMLGVEQLAPLWSVGGQAAIRAIHAAPPLSVLDWAEDTQLALASRVEPLDCYPTLGPRGFSGHDVDAFGPLGAFALAIHFGDTPELAWSRALELRGDRVVVFTEGGIPDSYAIAWRLRFDTVRSAAAFADRISASPTPGTAVHREDREVLFYGMTQPDRLVLWVQPTHCGTEADLPPPRSAQSASSRMRLSRFASSATKARRE